MGPLFVLGAEAKALWEKLRHSLRDALRRQQKCIKSGAPAGTIKPWKFQKQMGFLQKYMANKEREGNLEEHSADNLSQNNDYCVSPADEDEDPIIQSGSETIEGADLQVENSPLLSTETPTPAKRMKKDNVASILKQSMDKRQERAKERAKERRELLENLKPNQDPLYHFFMAMYETTKRMPPSFQFDVRKRVFTAVSDVEATLLNISTTIQHQYNQYSTVTTPVHSSFTDSSCSLISTNNEPPSTSSGINVIHYINDFSE